MFKFFLLFCLFLSSFSFASGGGSTYVFACDCSSDLSDVFSNVESHVIDENLDEVEKSIEEVEEALDKNIERLEKDILLLKETNKTAKLEILKLYEYNKSLEQYKDTLDNKVSPVYKELPLRLKER